MTTAYKFIAKNTISDLALVAKAFKVKSSAIFNASTAKERASYAKARAKAIKSLDTKHADRFANFEGLFMALQPVTGADEIALFRKADLNVYGKECAKRAEDLAMRKKEREEAKRQAEERANARTEARRKLLDAMKHLKGKSAVAVKTAFAEMEAI